MSENITSSSTSARSNTKVTMYHDGDCPLCNYEVNMMKTLDVSNAIHWVDITKDKSNLNAQFGSSIITRRHPISHVHQYA